MNVSPNRKGYLQFKWLIGCMLLVLWLQGNLFFGGTARAEDTPKIEIQSEIGFGAANVKQSTWTPVKITLHNKGNADLSGDLVIQVAHPNGNKDFSYAKLVELPKDSTKVISMLIPGFPYSNVNNTISFYEKSVKSGKKVALDGKTNLEAFPIPKETLQVGVLARDVDTMNFLSLLNQSGKKLNLIHLKQTEMPLEALGLDSFDVLVLNDFASDTLTKDQVQAIQQWTQRGGALIIGGGAGYSKTAAPFSSASPVTYQGTQTVTDLSELAKMGEKELAFGSPFTISKAALVNGAEAIVSDQTIPIYARSSYGNGHVDYVAYDLSLNPLASWNGNTRLWEQLLAGPIERANAYNLNQARYGGDSFWEMNEALDYYPSLQPPKLAQLALVLLVYAVIVGPILYFILRRLDRREWAWYIIPLVAIVTSFGIFQFGATNRASSMAQSFSTLTLNGSGSGIKQSMISVFLPKGGDLELKLPDKGAASPFLQSEVYPNLQLSGRSEFVFRQDQDSSSLVGLQDIAYSSIAKIAKNDEQPVAFGKLDYTITDLSVNGVKGEVTNHTTKDLTNVAILVNQSYLNVGDLKAGAAVSFNTAGSVTVSNGKNYGQLAFPYPITSKMLDNGRHQRALLNTFMQRNFKVAGGFTPMIIGWFRDQTSLPITSSGSVPTEQLTLVSQEMKLNYVTSDGRIVIPSKAIVPTLADNHLKMSALQFRDGPFMQMGGGDVTLVYTLPPLSGANYQKMEMTGDPNPEVTLELWNAQTNAWEPLAMKASQSWEGDKLQPYITEGKSIRMKATTILNNTMFRMPSVSLEGSVKR
ncbi:hypothetical protein GCM10008018_01920 [Paenibacillus marchantiophytorum]|uniref:DUF7408 domain-containing protein n=1 Tax=Paenibacillus marchantiophytorum TaxID=1619310 RepID=A0ABQ2BQP6_9BACL|nr:hypothetical protein [Paenibacillus marchantiophytorum]GGI43408.1 hypothetical protein GCM10008018_01920 [Paenibacillus marchantiophytorum]